MSKTIINGIDVSECCCFENEYCLWIKKYYETGITPKCQQVKDCYFKQLKCLQEENEELKKYQYTQEYLQSEIEKRQKALVEIREIVSGNYEILDPQAKQDIKKLIDEVLNDRD